MSKWLLCVLFWPLLTGDCLFSGDSCVVDNDRPGNCQMLKECAPLITEIQNAGTPMPARLRRKLQSLSCGFHYDEPLVCCQTPFTNADQDIPQTMFPNNGEGGGNTWLTPRPTTSTEDPWQNNQPSSGADPWASQPTTELDLGINKHGNQGPSTEPGVPRPITLSTNINDASEIPTYISVTSHRNLRLLPENCGDLDSDRIIGGRRTRLFEMPWMVLLVYDSPQGPRLSCGGTLITDKYVLTAAHCVSFLGSLTLSGVILGDHDVRNDPDCESQGEEGDKLCAFSRNVTIERVIAHPGYTPQALHDDIALIRISEPADFSLDNIKPICLPTTVDLQIQPLVGKKAIVAGWGATEDGLQSPVLLSVSLPIINNRDCEAAYRGSPKIHPTQMCAGGQPDKDSCGGDSGGPLMFPGRTPHRGTRYVQRGIVSYGSKRCGIGGYPGVYTNVAKYIDWILDNISN